RNLSRAHTSRWYRQSVDCHCWCIFFPKYKSSVMTTNYSNWSEANQYYLMSMIKVIRDQLERYRTSSDNKETFQHDYSNKIEQLKEIAEKMEAPPAIDNLVSKLNLSTFERDILLLCAGAELDSLLADLLFSSNAKE